MWEVLAPIVRWPLYSPARFFGIVLAAVIGMLVLGGLNDGPSQVPAPTPSGATLMATTPSHSPQPGSAVTSPPAPASSPGAVSAGGRETPPDAVDQSFATVDAAAAFVAAWARPDLDAARWSAQVRPLVTDELWNRGLSMTDPASTPDVAVAGEPREVKADNESTIFDVPTTGAWMRVSLDLIDGRWLVSAIEPAA